MTDLEKYLSGVKARLEKITPGPWCAYSYGNMTPNLSDGGPLKYIRLESEREIVGFIYCDKLNEPHICDAGIIASAPTDIKKLLMIVETLDAETSFLRHKNSPFEKREVANKIAAMKPDEVWE